MASTSKATLSSSAFDEYNLQLQATALKATKLAAALPSDVSFHRSIDSEFANDLDICSAKVLSLTNALLNMASYGESSKAGGSRGKGKLKLESQDDVVDSFDSLVVDAMDHLLERADMSLDQYLGRIKAPAIAVNAPKPTAQKVQTHGVTFWIVLTYVTLQKPNAPRGRLDPTLQHASHLPKPQLKFRPPPSNVNGDVWRPRLKHKYNAQVPLGYVFRDESEPDAAPSLHPYHYEITHLSYPPHELTPTESPVPPSSFDDTPFTYVSTAEQFQAMLAKLSDRRKVKEIAVDLEYHNYRSFAGFVCLMQISTREEDFVVDCLEPSIREEMESLNEVFTDAQVVKVFHGAESDIIWLQQNFNVYVVNLFDTFHASKVLDFPRHGLASLLEMYCDFIPDKRYQLADWRIRPLPQEMLAYARSDTHYLLFIYDNLRNALLDRSQSAANSRAPSPSGSPPPARDAFLREVLRRSEETSLRLYESEVYDQEEGSGPGGWDTLARKWNKVGLSRDAWISSSDGLGSSVERMKRGVYRFVHGWRDRVAREEDESTRYVLPNHYIFQLAEKPPADMAALLGSFQPVPPVIRRRAKELLDGIKEVVKEALGTSAAKPAAVVTADESGATASAKRDEDDKMVGIEETTAPEPSQAGPSRLWSTTPTSSVNKAASSSLFGTASAPSMVVSARYAAARSSLFGTNNSTPASNTGPAALRDRFLEVVSRIHSTLSIAPSVPTTLVNDDKQEVSDPAPAAASEPTPSVTGQPAEIPFVPPSQCQSKPSTGIEDDTIVVVGQARQKKRKRSDKPKKEKAKAAEGEADAEVEPFDYSTVSNILDDAPEPEPDVREPAGKKKRKQKGEPAYTYGNFPAPPRAHREVKNGNQSLTFK
ncbi:hypothetical protein GLOTRDRAFT_77494 [Gloeophyllum trabeum ATCC 11539]|uniref:HRDC domain-containing protein n=1 Tax=Gloeophyllum trabeum (strain ATCC 11539 / FP-39264 / Madison 617) TaxID=670483 RepID=S7RK45_GLOTA|nr:uncharacterized protein GLOTRDRAFT_77494 [Gloeophyllum trabeum ATCC 11539]EPQ54765.1 hypothetical protein GLOTRDRAFT_77494 [Gloeophyllum trabeum ATCC 11539]